MENIKILIFIFRLWWESSKIKNVTVGWYEGEFIVYLTNFKIVDVLHNLKIMKSPTYITVPKDNLPLLLEDINSAARKDLPFTMIGNNLKKPFALNKKQYLFVKKHVLNEIYK